MNRKSSIIVKLVISIILISPGTLLSLFWLYNKFKLDAIIFFFMINIFNLFVLYLIWRKKKNRYLKGWQIGAFILGGIFFVSWAIIPSLGDLLSFFIFTLMIPVVIIGIFISTIVEYFHINPSLNRYSLILIGTLYWAFLGAILGFVLDKIIWGINGGEQNEK